jgi:hypothetical protein
VIIGVGMLVVVALVIETSPPSVHDPGNPPITAER